MPAYPSESYPTLEVARKLVPNQTFSKGQIVAEVSTGVDEIQTLTVTGSGTYKLKFMGSKTAAIAHDASAATIQTALRNLPTIGGSNVTVSGSAGGPYTITFTADLGGLSVPILEVVEATGTAAATPVKTTVGFPKGAVKAWNSTKLTDPTAGPAVTAETGGSMPVGTYIAQMAWITAQGETLPSPGVAVIVPDATNDRIRFAAINAAGTPDDATGIRYYLNGVMVAQVAVATGAIAQTDVDSLPTGAAKAPQSRTNTAYVAADGTHKPLGVMPLEVASDDSGNVTLGAVAQTAILGHTIQEMPIFVTGAFLVSDLVGENSTLEEWVRGVHGGSISDSNAVVLF